MNSTVYNSKNKAILAILALILLIPTALAVYFASHKDTGAVTSGRLEQISVASPYGGTVVLTDNDSFEVYAEAIGYATSIEESFFNELSTETPYTVTLTDKAGDLVRTYSFYMVNRDDGCTFADADGKYYRLSEKSAAALLARSEFATVNAYAVVPNAAISGIGENPIALAATGGSWNYRTADGSFAVKDIPDSGERTTVKISLANIGTLAFWSDKAPDTVTVTVSENGQILHEGAYENLLNTNVMRENDTYYDLVIRAEWNQTEETGYYGAVTYAATLLYDVAPTYSMTNDGKINKGDFKVIKIRNFNDGDTLSASCDDYPFPAELNVYRFADGNTYAFLPAEYVFVPAAACNLTLTLSDGSSQTLRINLREGKEPTAAKQDYMVSDPNLQSVFTEVGFTELESTIAQKTASTNPTPLWDGKFVYPDADNKGTVGKGMAGYGTYRNVKSLYQREYFHYGLDIAMNEGDAVYAANNGKVVFAGNLALTGNTVIIDHGCSLFTYYYHLSSLSVAEGDAVSKSGVIGAAGSTGFAVKAGTATFDAAPQVHFAASLNGKYINPYYLWKYDISYPA